MQSHFYGSANQVLKTDGAGNLSWTANSGGGGASNINGLSDALVENVHFIYNQISMYNLGWKSLASNYSDVASMGCDPLAVSITLGIKKNQQVEDLEKIIHYARLKQLFLAQDDTADLQQNNDSKTTKTSTR